MPAIENQKRYTMNYHTQVTTTTTKRSRPARYTPYQNIRIELVREEPARPAPFLTSSRPVYDVMKKEALKLDREHFWALCLDGKNRLLGVNLVSIGCLTSAMAHPREVFKPVFLVGAAAVILVHNHPSGDPTPSREDRETTQRLKDVGELIGVSVLDHIIIGDGRYTSFADEGLLEGRCDNVVEERSNEEKVASSKRDIEEWEMHVKQIEDRLSRGVSTRGKTRGKPLSSHTIYSYEYEIKRFKNLLVDAKKELAKWTGGEA